MFFHFLITLIGIVSYIIEGRVCYLTMCDRAYPKKLAFQYLEDIKNEFERVNGAQIETAARPYAFIKFGMPCLCLLAFVLTHMGSPIVSDISLFPIDFIFLMFKIPLYKRPRNYTKIHAPRGI